MTIPAVISTCTDGNPCQMVNYGSECYIRCAVDQLITNGPQLAAVVDRARHGSKPHQEILQRAGIDYQYDVYSPLTPAHWRRGGR